MPLLYDIRSYCMRFFMLLDITVILDMAVEIVCMSVPMILCFVVFVCCLLFVVLSCAYYMLLCVFVVVVIVCSCFVIVCCCLLLLMFDCLVVDVGFAVHCCSSMIGFPSFLENRSCESPLVFLLGGYSVPGLPMGRLKDLFQQPPTKPQFYDSY